MADKKSPLRSLTPEQHRVCREQGTEAPFSGRLLHNRKNGVYHCVCCDRPLFTSDAKFDSGCGWPSFSSPFSEDSVRYVNDFSHGMQRVEIRCRHCDAHLGHVFTDGPAPRGERYCLNSVALSFVDKDTGEVTEG